MFDDKIDEGSFMETDVADFFTALAAGIGFEDTNISSWDFENVYINPEAFKKVNDFINDNDVIEKINAFANGASWEESGMSELNSDIWTYGDATDAKAEQKFLYFYILHSGQFQTYISNKYGSDWATNETINEKYYDKILAEVRSRLKGQVSLIGGGGDDDITEPIPVVDDDDDDYSVVSLTDSNYYTKQLATYETNYNAAIEKIEGMVTKLTALYDSFIGATGNDISKIRNDLTALITDLDNVKTKIANARKETFDRAASCQRCYVNWTNRDKYFNVYIDDTDGHVCGTEIIPDPHEYREPGLLESLFISTARAEGIDQEVFHKATIEEMLNS